MLQALLAKSRAAFAFDALEVDGDEVRFMQSFYCEEDEEPGDVAKRLSIDIQEALEPAGLAAQDIESDNDSLWGRIITLSVT